jgi:hypothetical protein
MKRRIAILLALMGLAVPVSLVAQNAVRIFGTNNAGQSIPVQVAADGSLKLTLNVAGYEFEGATDDAYETTLVVVDPTADRTITLPNADGVVLLSTLATNAPEIAHSVWGADNGLAFEGATADDFETTITPTDPTADRTITLPNLSGIVALLTGGQSFTPFYVGNGATPGSIYFREGTGGGTNTVQLIGPAATADVVVTLPAATGTVALVENKLSAFAATTSLELIGVISDETGTGLAVFGTSPTLTTPIFGGTATVGLAADDDTFIFDPPVKGANQFAGTFTSADLTGARTWTLPDAALNLSVTTQNYVLATGAASASAPSLRALVTLDLPSALPAASTMATSLTGGNGFALRTGITAADALVLQAYDNDTGPGYITFGTLTAGNTPTFDLASGVTIGGAAIYRAGGTDIPLADGGTGASLADPNADRIMFWDDNPGATAYLALGDSLAITTTTLDTIQDIRTSASPSFVGVSATGAGVTVGSGTGVTVNSIASVRQVVYKVTVASTNFIAADVTADVTLATLPAKTRLVGIYADLTTPFACTATCTTATLTMTVGKSAGGFEYLASFDADAAAAVFGDADAELGTSINAAGRIQNADLPSWSGATAVSARLTSGTGNIGTGAATNLSQGSVVFYLVTEILP